ncbi:WXG100 family type VII secretion target [Nonomuraea indica]|uniref:WXG100 family type VII secretion target n=1 Tax=Nonomuraea indica TaxID=1581193 RepID=A0ABW8A373_9ACTN|nr:WXG100 family type VII secretion target [Nonomuraea indica]
MTYYGASPEQVQKAANLVQAAATQIQGLRKGVAGTVQELLDSGPAKSWQGDAAAKYRMHMAQWDQGAQRIIDSLERIYDNMNVSAGIYSAAAAEAGDNLKVLGEHVGANENAVDSLINIKV